MTDSREFVLSLADDLLFKPYVWGGDDGIAGFDCSGLMVELLSSVGILPYKGDFNAAALYAKFAHKQRLIQEIQPGDLVFYNNPITHVEICYDILNSGTILTLGAMGGGSTTLTIADAIKQNAYIKVRPIKSNVFAIVNPF